MTLMLHAITSTYNFWSRCYTIGQRFVIPSLLTNVSALPGKHVLQKFKTQGKT